MTATRLEAPAAVPRPSAGVGTMIRALVRSLRPRQWTKNGVVLVGLIFARQLGQPESVVRATLALVDFCLLSGAVYLANDLVDLEKDRRHPVKRHRPLAAGLLSRRVAAAAAALLAAGALALALALSRPFFVAAVAYLVLQGLYLACFKHLVILDVLALAAGFVLRASAGAVVIDVPISPWLYVCTMLLALFLALGKRRQELLLLAVDAAEHRPALEQYTVGLLDHLMQIVTTSLLFSYMLYTFSAENLPRNHAMMLTIPFVLYGLFRYLYLVHVRGEGGAPDEVLLRDAPLALCVGLWALSAVLILYLSPRA